MLTFGLPKDSVFQDIPLGNHLSVRIEYNGAYLSRPYCVIHSTPQSIEFLVKYENGKMSQYLKQMKVGDYLEMTGPQGDFTYTKGKYDELLMIAGGTGIAPMIRILRHILADHSDRAITKLLYANKSDEIPFREELTRIHLNPVNRTQVTFVISTQNVKPEPLGGASPSVIQSDVISSEILKRVFPSLCNPSPFNSTQVLICGPPEMEMGIRGDLKRIGFNVEENCFTFTVKGSKGEVNQEANLLEEHKPKQAQENNLNQDKDQQQHTQNQEKEQAIKKPVEPQDCCGSCCPNCVYFQYLDQLSDYLKKTGSTEPIENTISDLNISPGLKAFLIMESKFKK
uniref:FAD-binding FR-type domain-containing protein n=1 Tax=Arcella intermedia TaxID=1963864 RepID=A0A6B2L8Q5_9EUKA